MDIKQFKEKILPLRDKLFKRAKYILGSHEDAEEIVQEVMLKIWQKRDTIDETANFEAFAITVTRNMCYDSFKTKHYKHKGISIDEFDYEYNLEGDNEQKYAEYKEANELIQKIIEDFPPRWREILCLRDVEGYTNQEVAEILDVTETVVKVTLSRTRKRIREVLIKKYNYNYNEN